MPSTAATYLPASARVVPHTLMSHAVYLLLSAVLLALAFPMPGWGTLAHIALVPMVLLTLRSDSARRVAWMSLLMAWVWWLWMIRWMQPVTTGGWIGLSFVCALYTPISLLAIRWIDRRYRGAMVFVLPLVWVSVELYRCNAPSGGFAWFTLAQSQAPFRPEHHLSRIMQVADLAGWPLVSFLVGMTNGLIVDMLHRPWIKPTLTGRRMARTIRVGSIAWVIAFALAWMYGEFRINQTEQVATGGIRVAVVQTNIPQSNKESATNQQEQRDWDRLLDLTRLAGAARPALIAWPETCVPGSLNAEALEHYRSTQSGLRGYERYHEQIAALADELNTHLVVGAGATNDWRPVRGPGDRWYDLPRFRANAAFVYLPDGTQWPARYDKMHRVPFGEYIPWVNAVPGLKELFFKLFVPEAYQFDYSLTPGKGPVYFEIEPSGASQTRPSSGSVTFGTPICFEDTVWHVGRSLVYDADCNKRSNMYINITNDGWFASTNQPWQELQLATFRCVENRVPMARAVNTGVSCFIDSTGRVEQLVTDAQGRSQDVDGYLVGTMRFDGRASVFGRVGVWPSVLMAIGTAALIIGGWWRRPAPEPGRKAAPTTTTTTP